MSRDPLQVFALEASREFGEGVARALGTSLAEHEERDFEDGEHKVRPLQSVRGADVYVIHSLYGDTGQSVNDKLIRLLLFLGAIRDSAAARVTAVIPYLCYARKERKTKPRDPVSTRYLAAMLEAVGADRVVTMDVHNLAAYQNAFRCRTEHLEAQKLFLERFGDLASDRPAVVVSPDVGGIKRAEQFREALGRRWDRSFGDAFMEKQRSAGVVSGEALVGEVEGRLALIVDDMIAGGTTVQRTARACRQAGASGVVAAATHGLFVGDAGDKLADSALDRLVVTNTVPPFRLVEGPARDKLEVLDAAPLFAEAIRRMHEGGSLADLMSV